MAPRKILVKYSCEEVYNRMSNGLCIFCEDLDTPGHHDLKHKGVKIFVTEADDETIMTESDHKPIAEESLVKSDEFLTESVMQPDSFSESLEGFTSDLQLIGVADQKEAQNKSDVEGNMSFSLGNTIEHMVCKQFQEADRIWEPGGFLAKPYRETVQTGSVLHSEDQRVWEPGGFIAKPTTQSQGIESFCNTIQQNEAIHIAEIVPVVCPIQEHENIELIDSVLEARYVHPKFLISEVKIANKHQQLCSNMRFKFAAHWRNERWVNGVDLFHLVDTSCWNQFLKQQKCPKSWNFKYKHVEYMVKIFQETVRDKKLQVVQQRPHEIICSRDRSTEKIFSRSFGDMDAWFQEIVTSVFGIEVKYGCHFCWDFTANVTAEWRQPKFSDGGFSKYIILHQLRAYLHVFSEKMACSVRENSCDTRFLVEGLRNCIENFEELTEHIMQEYLLSASLWNLLTKQSRGCSFFEFLLQWKWYPPEQSSQACSGSFLRLWTWQKRVRFFSSRWLIFGEMMASPSYITGQHCINSTETHVDVVICVSKEMTLVTNTWSIHDSFLVSVEYKNNGNGDTLKLSYLIKGCGDRDIMRLRFVDLHIISLMLLYGSLPRPPDFRQIKKSLERLVLLEDQKLLFPKNHKPTHSRAGFWTLYNTLEQMIIELKSCSEYKLLEEAAVTRFSTLMHGHVENSFAEFHAYHVFHLQRPPEVLAEIISWAKQKKWSRLLNGVEKNGKRDIAAGAYYGLLHSHVYHRWKNKIGDVISGLIMFHLVVSTGSSNNFAGLSIATVIHSTFSKTRHLVMVTMFLLFSHFYMNVIKVTFQWKENPPDQVALRVYQVHIILEDKDVLNKGVLLQDYHLSTVFIGLVVYVFGLIFLVWFSISGLVNNM